MTGVPAAASAAPVPGGARAPGDPADAGGPRVAGGDPGAAGGDPGAVGGDPGAVGAGPGAAGGPEDRRWRLRHLPLPLVASGVLAVLAVPAGGLLAGGTGAIGAAAGVVLITLGYLLSTLVVAWADGTAPALVMPVGMMAYVVKVTVVAGAATVAAVSGWPGLVPMAWGIAAAVLVWTGTHIWWLARNGPHRRVRSGGPG